MKNKKLYLTLLVVCLLNFAAPSALLTVFAGRGPHPLGL